MILNGLVSDPESRKKSQDHNPKYKLQIPGLVPVDNESDYINTMEL